MDLEKLKIDRSEPPRRKRRGNPAWILPVGLLALVAIALWLFRAPLLERLDRFRLPEVKVVRVTESHPAAVGAVRGAAANGYIVARRRAALSSDTPGRIVEMLVEEGSVVKEGDVVARIFSEEFSAALKRAEADVEVARAALQTAQAQVTSSKSELERLRAAEVAAQKRIAEDEAGLELAELNNTRTAKLVEERVVSTMDMDAARTELDQARARLDSARADRESAVAAFARGESEEKASVARVAEARARLASAEAALEEARARLSKTDVRAPFDGVVVLKDAEVGEVVSPNTTGGASTRGAVCTMVDFDSLEVQADVPETNLAAVVKGDPAAIYLDAFPDRRYSGRVSRIWPTADRQKATVEVRVTIDEPDELLRPEMGVRVVFSPEGEDEAATDRPTEPQILIQRSAVVRIDGTDGVFVLERDVVRFREVALGEERSSRVRVEGGLQAGETIVLDPPPTLNDGDRVRIDAGASA